MLETEAQLAQVCHLCLQVKRIFLKPECTLCMILCCKKNLLVRYTASNSALYRKTYLASCPSAALAVQLFWKLSPAVQWSAQ